MTADEKESFRKIWVLIAQAEGDFTELLFRDGLDKLRAAMTRCQTFANQVKLNDADAEGETRA